MCGFDELEDALVPEKKPTISPEFAAREFDNHGFGELDPHQPLLQQSRASLRVLLRYAAITISAPLRALTRFAWRN